MKSTLSIATALALAAAAGVQAQEQKDQKKKEQRQTAQSSEQQQQKDQQQQQAQQGQQPGSAGAGAAGQRGSGQSSQRMQTENLERFIGFIVVDQEEQKIGTVEAFWEDQPGQAAYIGVKAQGLPEGQLLIIPAQRAEVNPGAKKVKVAFTQEVVRKAPKLGAQQELNQRQQQRVAAFYRQHGFDPEAMMRQAQRSAQTQDQATITLKEEELDVGKRQVQAGGVLLRKVVKTEQVTEPVTLQSEKLIIERQSGQGRPATGEIGEFEEKRIYIPLRKEVPVVDKDVRVDQVIEVGKETERRRLEVGGQVREEELRIIKEQGTDVQIEGEDQQQQQQRDNRPQG